MSDGDKVSNWPQASIYQRRQGPIEVEGGLLFEPDQRTDALACADRVRGNGRQSCVWTMPRDCGLFVSIR